MSPKEIAYLDSKVLTITRSAMTNFVNGYTSTIYFRVDLSLNSNHGNNHYHATIVTMLPCDHYYCFTVVIITELLGS